MEQEYHWEGLTTMGTLKYWEEEEPQIFRTEHSELRYYAKAGKLQVYQRKEGTAFGVTKGVVIPLGDTDPGELNGLVEFIARCIDDHHSGDSLDGES